MYDHRKWVDFFMNNEFEGGTTKWGRQEWDNFPGLYSQQGLSRKGGFSKSGIWKEQLMFLFIAISKHYIELFDISMDT